MKKSLAPFVLLQLSSFTSITSGSMAFILIPWMAIALTGQASAAGLVVSITSIPGLLLSPVVGSIIDKLGRRKTALITEAAIALSSVLVLWVAGVGAFDYTAMILLFTLRSIVGSGGPTARKALIPDVARVGGLTLERANSIHESVFAGGFALGPALGALSIAAFGAANSFWVIFAISLLSVVLTLLLRVAEVFEPADEADSGSLLQFGVQGFKILFETPSVLLLMSTVLSLAMIYLPTEMVVLPKYYTLLDDPRGIGFLISTMAAFTMIGSLFFEFWAKLFKFSSLLRIAILGVGLAMLPMSFLPPQWVMLIFGAILGLAWGPLPPLMNTVIQRKISPNKRGRVFSLEMTIWTGGPMLTMTLAGAAVDGWGVQPVYWLLTALVLAAGLIVSTRKRIQDLNVTEFAD